MLTNPFFFNNSLLPIASLNRLKIIELPSNINDNEVIQKSANEIFSPYQIINEVKKYCNLLEIPNEMNDSDYPLILEKCLDSEKYEIRKKANEIVEKFGRRLGYILLTLKINNESNKLARIDWNNEHWEYWQNIDTIILVGGLASGKLGELFKDHIYNVFKEVNQKSYNIILYKYSSNTALIGCSRVIRENGAHLIFDFGQSYIKRAITYSINNEVNNIKILDKVKSYFLVNNKQYNSIELHNYILNVIVSTIKECNEMKIAIGKEIILSIANYIVEGKIIGRGNYGRLGDISEEYDKYLSKCLSDIFNFNYEVKLIHDGTAASYVFNEIPNSACISLGTAFGIGFPNNIYLPKKLSNEVLIKN